MKKCCLFLKVFIFFMLQISVFGQINETLKGIVPLVTKRQEIESRFGIASGDCQCLYESKQYSINVNYSKNKCEQGWNIPEDTIIEIRLTPKSKLSLNELNLDLTSFYRFTYDDFSYTLSDLKKGIQYFLNLDGELKFIDYIPTLIQGSDEKLRCKNAVKYNPMSQIYVPVSKFGYTENWDYIMRDIFRLCEEYSAANTEEKYSLYSIVYFSNSYNKSQQSNLINRINKKFQDFLKGNNTNVFVLNGGIRQKFEIESFILPKEYPPPTANPD